METTKFMDIVLILMILTSVLAIIVVVMGIIHELQQQVGILLELDALIEMNLSNNPFF